MPYQKKKKTLTELPKLTRNNAQYTKPSQVEMLLSLWNDYSSIYYFWALSSSMHNGVNANLLFLLKYSPTK